MFVQNKRLAWNLLTNLILFFLITTSLAASATDDTVTSPVFTAPQHVDVILPEIDEFATNEMGNAWDMKEPTDLSFYRDESRITNSDFSDGFYTGQMTTGEGGERITLLSAGAPNNTAMRIGKIGYNYPIDADHYRYLTFRMWRSNDEANSGLIQWFADDSYSSEAMGISNGYAVDPGNGWATYVIDLATIGIQAGEQDWIGTIRELIIHPYAGPGAADSTLKLDWARLTHEDPRTARPYTIRWSGNDGTPVSLYASRGDKVVDDDDLLLASGLTENSFTWQTGTAEAGTYYIGLKNSTGVVWSTGAIVLNTPPQIEITKPSMLSGQDYATIEKNNAWDMNEPTDLNDKLPFGWKTCINNPLFIDGIHTADLTACSPDSLFVDTKYILGYMNPEGKFDPLIDTSKYRYFSFRYYHHGEQNIAKGWVARLGWWQKWGGTLTNPTVMSRDIMLVEGWHTYKVDLWAPDVVDENHSEQRSWRDSAPNRLRFDPSELSTERLPATIELDWIKLTAMDEVARGQTFNIEFETASTQPTTVTFYFDQDTNPGNGHTLITQTNAPATMSPPAEENELPSSEEILAPTHNDAAFTVYLPIAMNNYTNTNCEDCVQWNTSNVAAGQYYVCAEIDDSYNSTYLCSEAPVIVR